MGNATVPVVFLGLTLFIFVLLPLASM